MAQLLEDELKDIFIGKAQSIVLFGSYARGEQDEGSDVDVVLVASGPKDDLERVAEEYEPRFRKRFGATLSALVYDASEAQELSRRAPALFDSIARDAIVVAGFGPREWVNLGAST